jgi:predicted deacylase
MARTRITQDVDGVAGTVLVEVLGREGRVVAGPRAAIIGAIHGNETVGLELLQYLETEAPNDLVGGSLLLVHGNPAASAIDRRHTPEGQDLNRLFDADSQERLARAPEESLSPEERRAKEVGPLLMGVDAILDVHSTSRPTPPFVLFRDDQRNQRMALRLGVEHLVTGMHESTLVEGGLASNAGLRPGERTAGIGFTFEAGHHGAPGNFDRARSAAVRLLHALGIWRTAPDPMDVEPRIYEIIERVAQAPEGAAPWQFVVATEEEARTERTGPPRTLQSFENVQAGELVLRRGTQVVRAPSPFTMLMPAPAAQPGEDLFFTLQPRHGGLMRTGEAARTDKDARREAEAVERMLDLLDADAYAQGATRMSFDPHVVLGLCAEEIDRIDRLPYGHAHRRIGVVGRGDWSSDDGDRRVSQRYRRAMRQAIRSGVPIDRYQLLRGASLGWLDALTGEGMKRLLVERSTRADAPDIRMYVADRQPHTVSLLVLGDIDLALRSGDFRSARVAVVVEAATAEPDGEDVRVNIVRAGLLSARREVLVATQRFLAVLRRQHRGLLQGGPLAEVGTRIPQALSSDGALIPNPTTLDDLRLALRHLQVRRWCEQLDSVLEPGREIRGRYGRGQWLASTIVASGVRDIDALKGLLRVEGERSFVDGAALSRWVADPAGVAVNETAGRPAPLQPLSAAEVDADNLERWIGWKRYLRTGQVLPGTRGLDVDLAFTTREIHVRIASIYQRARALGAESPGDVRVVVCGDGAMPRRERIDLGQLILGAHKSVVGDPNVDYLRVQHASGTHAAWLKDFLQMLASRPPGAAPAAVQWEPDHGASVNVILLATRERGLKTVDFSLDGWRMRACAVVLQAFAEQEREYELALFTGLDDLESNELLAFGRAHAEGLLLQGGDRLGGQQPVDLDAVKVFAVAQFARWIRRLRRASDEPGWPTAGGSGAIRRAIALLGLEDAALASELVRVAMEGESVDRAAALVWDSIDPWPGKRWAELLRSDYTGNPSSKIGRT